MTSSLSWQQAPIASGQTRRSAVSAALPSRQTRGRHPPILALIAVALMLTANLATQLPIGPVSLSGLMTLALPGALLMVTMANLLLLLSPLVPRSRTDNFIRQIRRVPLLLRLFAVFSVLSLLIFPSGTGLQNVGVYMIFVLAITFVASDQVGNYTSIVRWMRWAGLGGGALYILQSFTWGGDTLEQRSVSMTLLVALALCIPPYPRPKQAAGRHLVSLAQVVLALTALIMTLSRTAIAAALVLLLFLAIRARRTLRPLIVIGTSFVLVAATGLLLALYPPLMERFSAGDNAKVGGVTMNTSGRSELWALAWQSYNESLLWGHGPGSAGALIETRFHIHGVGHPHNDYIRILHDFGAIGATLFWGGVVTLLIRLWTDAHRTDRPISWSAVLGVLAVMILAITDNVIVYQFVMLPVAVLCGLALRENEPHSSTQSPKNSTNDLPAAPDIARQNWA